MPELIHVEGNARTRAAASPETVRQQIRRDYAGKEVSAATAAAEYRISERHARRLLAELARMNLAVAEPMNVGGRGRPFLLYCLRPAS